MNNAHYMRWSDFTGIAGKLYLYSRICLFEDSTSYYVYIYFASLPPIARIRINIEHNLDCLLTSIQELYNVRMFECSQMTKIPRYD